MTGDHPYRPRPGVPRPRWRPPPVARPAAPWLIVACGDAWFAAAHALRHRAGPMACALVSLVLCLWCAWRACRRAEGARR